MSASHRTSSIKKRRRQAGIVLPVVLIFMVIMTLIGIAVIRGVTLEERIAGNLHNQQVAFQAAEEALRDCEEYIQGTATPKLYRTQSRTTIDPNSMPAFNEANWSNASYTKAVTLKEASTRQSAGASCMIEAFRTPCTPMEISATVELCDAFRVTARGYGATQGTVVRIQSFLSFP